MKNLLKTLPLFLLGALFLTACGSKDVAGTCAVGQIYTAQGCVQNQQAYNNGYQTGYNQNGNCTAPQVNTQLGCLSPGGPCNPGQGWDPRYNRCYAPINGYNGYNGGNNNPYYNGGYNNTGFGGAIGLPPTSGNNGYNQCSYGYVQTQQGCLPRCSMNYNGGNCVNY